MRVCQVNLSNTTRIARNILTWKGVHWFATRVGGRTLSRLSFDQKFRNGEWNFEFESKDLILLIQKHCAGGHLLILGCGRAAVARQIAPDSYESLLGLDVSSEA